MSRPLFLISNDDGYFSPGISILAEIAKKYGDVVVVAPDAPQSGQSSALTVETPIKVKLREEKEGYTVYSCTGKPADCVKLALNELLPKRPDFILAGINHGANASVNVLYSGTMGIALEGAIVGIPAVGFSVNSHSFDFDFSHAIPVFNKVLQKIIEVGVPEGICLNVNAPNEEIKGVKVCRQSKGRWDAEFVNNVDPRNQQYYWLTGKYINGEPEAEDTDINAMKNGYVSIVPTRCDMTSYDMLQSMKEDYEK